MTGSSGSFPPVRPGASPRWCQSRSARLVGPTGPSGLRGPTWRVLLGTANLRRAMGSLIKKRRKRMRKKKHKKMLKATRWQRRAGK